MILKYSFINLSDHTLQNISSILCVSNNKLLLVILINIYHLAILCLLLLRAFVPLLVCLLVLRTRIENNDALIQAVLMLIIHVHVDGTVS